MPNYYDCTAEARFVPRLWEFGSRVYLGEKYGYADSVALEGYFLERPVAFSYWRSEDGWGFVLQGGSTVLVPHGNVRFIHGQPAGRLDMPVQGDKENESVGQEESAEHPETPATANLSDQNGFPVSKAQAAYADENPAPKRRGRPPKVRPAGE